MELFEKAKECIFQWSNRVQDLWTERRYFYASVTCLVPPVIVALILILLGMGISAAVGFLRQHYTHLILAALVLWAFAAWWDKHKGEKIMHEREEQEIRERQNYADRLEVARMKDATYTTQAKILFAVSRELGPLGIVPPARLSDLYSPGRTIPKANGTVALSLYLLQKDCETVDTDLLRYTLQTKIDQRLQAGDFPDIPEQHLYRGRVHSGFVIDTVRDSSGFVEVYTALTDDAYCRYCEQRNLNSHLLLPSVDRRDVDY